MSGSSKKRVLYSAVVAKDYQVHNEIALLRPCFLHAGSLQGVALALKSTITLMASIATSKEGTNTWSTMLCIDVSKGTHACSHG